MADIHEKPPGVEYYYSANIKGDIKQLNSLWDGESKDLMAWRRIPSSAYRPGSRASRLSMPE